MLVSNLVLFKNLFRRHVSLIGGISYEQFKKIFASNKSVVEEFVAENTPLETIESWVQKKAKSTKKQTKPSRGLNTLAKWKVIVNKL